jgi:hypothetical protein
VNILPLSSISMCQIELDREKPGVSDILRQREMSLKSFRVKKFDECESQQEETVNVLPLSSTFIGQIEQDQENPGVSNFEAERNVFEIFSGQNNSRDHSPMQK